MDHCRAVVADHRKVFSVLPLVTRLEHEDGKGIAGILSSSASEDPLTGHPSDVIAEPRRC